MPMSAACHWSCFKKLFVWAFKLLDIPLSCLSIGYQTD